jgi:ferredoxin
MEERIMAMKIIDECIACGACEAECPNNAISEGDPIFKIDANICTECSEHGGEPHCVPVCPSDAIIRA